MDRMDTIMRALTDRLEGRGTGRLRHAWFMATASYAHSRGYDLTIPEAFAGAWHLFWRCLRED